MPKVKLGDLQPLPEPVEEMTVEVQETPVSFYQDSLLAEHVAVNMLSGLQLDGTASRNSTPFLSQEGSFDDVFGYVWFCHIFNFCVVLMPATLVETLVIWHFSCFCKSYYSEGQTYFL